MVLVSGVWFNDWQGGKQRKGKEQTAGFGSSGEGGVGGEANSEDWGWWLGSISGGLLMSSGRRGCGESRKREKTVIRGYFENKSLTLEDQRPQKSCKGKEK